MAGNQKGFTLVEILVVLALSGLVTGAVYKSFTAQQRVYIAQDQVAGLQQDIRASLEIMLKEIRMAGYDPRGTDIAGFLAASNTRLQFTADHNGNGQLITPGPPDTNDPHEDVTYSLKPESDPNDDGVATVFPSELRRTVWGAPESMVENVEVLNFVYLDESDAVMETPVTGANLDRIRSVQVCLVLRADKADRHFDNSRSAIAFSNLLRDAIVADPSLAASLPAYATAQAWTWTPPNDGHRRRLLKTTVKCRNAGI
ncbi:MAG: prepilin-type N-terminal cleavage/methylation domain-containing protein [Syntrophobacteraceae bacterium]|nr:prepilin-type N-terminal cleavage/methylation domain-containing protein [Syntrophobacteraceae bacterium]